MKGGRDNMTRSGNCIAVLACLLLAMALPALAAVDAQVDRGQVYLGDSVRLTLTATDGEDVEEEGFDVVVERLVIEEELGEEA